MPQCKVLCLQLSQGMSLCWQKKSRHSRENVQPKDPSKIHGTCWDPVKRVPKRTEGVLMGSSIHGALGRSVNPDLLATTVPTIQLSSAVTSPPLLSYPYLPTGHPEACWNTMPVYAQAPTVVQTWKLHHRWKMALFNWKSTTLSKHVSCKLQSDKTLYEVFAGVLRCILESVLRQRYNTRSAGQCIILSFVQIITIYF